ncbi:unnamed protein product [Schistosoma curassoni]|nr:unnamed protein product [Schistosoma curassoni]
MLVDESQEILNELVADFGWTHEFLSHDVMIPNSSICTAECSQPTSDWTNDPSWIMNMQAFSTDKSHRSSNNSSQDVSKLEVLSMMRDAKRRRQSYRGIHTARKSYTEVLREIIAQQTEMLTASQELSEQQSQDRRSNSVESLSNQTENVHKRSHYSHKYKTSDTSRIQHYSPFNSPSSSSATTRRYKETYRNTSKSTLKHTHHQSSKWNDRRQSSSALSPSSSAISPSSSPSLSSSSKHRTSSSEMNKSFHHDNDVVSPVHKKLKKHKKHSKHKHKHKSKK